MPCRSIDGYGEHTYIWGPRHKDAGGGRARVKGAANGRTVGVYLNPSEAEGGCSARLYLFGISTIHTIPICLGGVLMSAMGKPIENPAGLLNDGTAPAIAVLPIHETIRVHTPLNPSLHMYHLPPPLGLLCIASPENVVVHSDSEHARSALTEPPGRCLLSRHPDG